MDEWRKWFDSRLEDAIEAAADRNGNAIDRKLEFHYTFSRLKIVYVV